MMRAYERFLNYVKFDTRSDPLSETRPSTAKQHELAKFLEGELRELGLENVRRTEHGYVYAELPASDDSKPCGAVGLIAHIDTSPDISGENVRARIVHNYDGKDLPLDEAGKYVLSPEKFPSLTAHIGQDLIVTDGSTLLGADDKAGVAEIMCALERIIAEKLPHRAIKVCFTTDEEIGCGVQHFDVEGFGAEFAYTLDGGDLQAYSIETFNAAAAVVTVNGENIHPGSAKGKMKNAILYAMEFNGLLPANERPDSTEGYEGFYHIGDIEGNEERCVMRYILRDHDAGKLAQKKDNMRRIAADLNSRYGSGTIELDLRDSYRNMREVLDNCPEVVARMVNAMKRAGISDPVAVAVRGGTDGARLSFMGLPCPNMPTGGYNYHGRYEYISVQAMDTAVEMILGVVEPD